MLLAHIVEKIAADAAERRMKRAGMAIPALAVGLQAPKIYEGARAREHETVQRLDAALGQKLAAGKGMVAKTPMQAIGYGAVNAFGGALGGAGADLLKDLAAKAYSAVTGIGTNAAQQAILTQLKQQDPVLSQADDKLLMEAYHTMTRFAPVLSTDKNAVRSFLRQAVMSGHGPDYMSIKLLADSEHAVNGQKGHR